MESALGVRFGLPVKGDVMRYRMQQVRHALSTIPKSFWPSRKSV
jgi:hypothetical protein